MQDKKLFALHLFPSQYFSSAQSENIVAVIERQIISDAFLIEKISS